MLNNLLLSMNVVIIVIACIFNVISSCFCLLCYLQKDGKIIRLNGVHLSRPDSAPLRMKYCVVLHVPHESNKHKWAHTNTYCYAHILYSVAKFNTNYTSIAMACELSAFIATNSLHVYHSDLSRSAVHVNLTSLCTMPVQSMHTHADVMWLAWYGVWLLGVNYTNYMVGINTSIA